MRDQWIQYLPKTAKEIALQENTEISKEDFIRTLMYSSTSPYSRKKFTDIDVVKKDNYTICKYQPGDSPEYHKELLSSKRRMRMLMSSGWLDNNLQLKEIEYKINQLGFRDNHFTDEPGIACFGCSNTFGTGLAIEQTWPAIIKEITGQHTYNLGIPALSLEVGAYYAINWLEVDIPNLTAIAVFVPPSGRLLRAYKQNQTTFFSRWRDLLDQDISVPVKEQILNSLITTTQINEHMALKTLEMIAKIRNIPFVVHTIDETQGIDWARDLQHRGPKTQRKVAEQIINKLGKY